MCLCFSYVKNRLWPLLFVCLSYIIKHSRALKFQKYERFYSLNPKIALVAVGIDPQWFMLNVVFQGNC